MITCPTCCTEHQFSSKNEIYKLIKNWAVLAYAETFARQKKELANVGVKEVLAIDQVDSGETPIGRSAASHNYSISMHSNIGLKNNSVLVIDDGGRIDESEHDVQRSTVDQFLDEEPPTLQHN